MFKTEDIEKITRNGLKLICTKDGIFKLLNGKKVASFPIEEKINFVSKDIQNVIVFGDGMEKAGVLIFVEEKTDIEEVKKEIYKNLILIIFIFSYNLFSDNINIMNNNFSFGSYAPSCGGLYGIGSDYYERIKAYVFQHECPWGNNDSYNPLPEDKRELGTNDIVYKDEQCMAIVLEKFPCYCSTMGKEEWVFEFEASDGQTSSGRIEHDPYINYQYGWTVFGLTWIGGLPMPCFLADLWHGIQFYQTAGIHCESNQNKFGIWRLKFKYYSSTDNQWVRLKEWNIEFRNIDRGRIKLTLPDNPESILPDGLEIEPETSSGEESARLNIYFENCDGPVQGQSISFRQQFINGTGGHNHFEPSEPPECEATSSHPTCGIISPSTVTTDRNGNATGTYTAPIYSGEVKIKAVTNYNDFERESEKGLKIMVPNLIPFSSLIATNVPDNIPCVHGNQNLYVTQKMEEQLGYLVSYWFWDEANPSPKLYPRMTAGSLPWGGKFDDGECWSDHRSSNHYYHRQGMDMDIGKLNFTDPNKRNAFEDLADRLYDKGEIFIEIDHQNNNHWHFK